MFADIARRAIKTLGDNSPAVLTGVGVAGVIGTAVLTGKATFKAAEILHAEADAQLLDVRDFKAQYVVKRTWHLYIPAVSTGALTITAVILSTTIGMRRTAAMAAAYSLSEKAIAEYKDKVIEKFGENKEREVRDELAQDRVNAKPPSNAEVIVTGDGDVLCKDDFSGRYFRSSMESIKAAQNDLNYQLLRHDYASLTEFYGKLGLDPLPFSDDLGWRSDNQLEITFSAVITPDKEPCIVMSFVMEPVRDYWKSY